MSLKTLRLCMLVNAQRDDAVPETVRGEKLVTLTTTYSIVSFFDTYKATDEEPGSVEMLHLCIVPSIMAGKLCPKSASPHHQDNRKILKPHISNAVLALFSFQNMLTRNEWVLFIYTSSDV